MRWRTLWNVTPLDVVNLRIRLGVENGEPLEQTLMEAQRLLAAIDKAGLRQAVRLDDQDSVLPTVDG